MERVEGNNSLEGWPSLQAFQADMARHGGVKYTQLQHFVLIITVPLSHGLLYQNEVPEVPSPCRLLKETCGTKFMRSDSGLYF